MKKPRVSWGPIRGMMGPHLKIAVSGTSGFLGSHLCRELEQGNAERVGHTLIKLVRRPTRRKNEVHWDPVSQKLEVKKLEGTDAWIHLAGENLFHWRWTPAKRRRIWESRVASTTFLAGAMDGLKEPPKMFITASGVGYYGDIPTGRPENFPETAGKKMTAEVDESVPKGKGFLSDVVEAWEKAAVSRRAVRPKQAVPRIVHLRSGMVLSPYGGALAKLLPSFRLGMGAVMGPGTQWAPWISLRDWTAAVQHILNTELEGPVNLVAPRPVTQREFADALAKALGRPRLLRIPSWAVRLGMGDMGKEMLLFGQKAVPRKLLDSGYAFKDPEFEGCLRNLFGKPYRNG